ncbi:putative cysteine desulfurase [Dichotomopilus funicola]|uniref:Cysteine desulfurase n=1 Tax=Dichotomopilus funicola TaxID=1934379 RepID=A0AAN6V0K0_9PEZI|nr:putative cysteine desulfurase [Dichotomopilus funicola]
MTTLDLDEVRAAFPALAGDRVYFDNAGGSQALGAVADWIRDYLLNTNVQLGASYTTGKESTARYNEGYAAAAEYIGVSPSEIVLGPSTSQLFRNVSHALRFSEHDELVLSALDHEANIGPWVDLAVRQNVIIKWWRPDPDAPPNPLNPSKTNPTLLASDLPSLITPKTRLVALTHASNILGTIHDIPTIATTIHALNPSTLVCVDAVAYAPHRPVHIPSLGGVDLYAFSWYKVFGPHLAQLYASPRAMGEIRSLGHFFKEGRTLEDKLGLAGAGYELVSGLPAVVGYLRGKWEGIERQEGVLVGVLLGWLRGREGKGKGGITIYGERGEEDGESEEEIGKKRVPTVSFTVEGWSAKEVVERVEEECGGRVGIRWGSFYSERLAKEVLGLGEDGVVRVSMVHYNTVEEVKTLIGLLEKVLDERK